MVALEQILRSAELKICSEALAPKVGFEQIRALEHTAQSSVQISHLLQENQDLLQVFSTWTTLTLMGAVENITSSTITWPMAHGPWPNKGLF